MGPDNRRYPVLASFVTVCFLSLVLAACGGDSSADSTTTSAAVSQATTTGPDGSATTATSQPETTSTTVPDTTTTTAPDPVPEFAPSLISYRYPEGGKLEYSLSITQDAVIRVEAGAPEEALSGPIDMSTILEGTISYQISPGSEDNTTTIRVLSDFEVAENKMSMGGINMPTPPDVEAPGFETPIDITVIVDLQGNVLEVFSEVLDNPFGGEGFLPTNPVGSQELNRPFGPAFPDHPLNIGDTWTEHSEQEGPVGMGLITTTAEHHLVGVNTDNGSTVLVIESAYRTEGFEWDMSDLLQGMFGALSEELTEEEPVESEGFLPEFSMLIIASPSTVSAVTHFDADAGLVISGEYQAQGEVTSQMAIPGDTDGPSTIVSSVSYEQTVTYELISPVN
jgi:hypothetical protein